MYAVFLNYFSIFLIYIFNDLMISLLKLNILTIDLLLKFIPM